MHIVNIHDAKTHLSDLIRRALAGEEVFIARANQPLVRLEPLSRDTRPRAGGQWQGRLWVAPDFNEPDGELEALFYDGPVAPHGKP